MSCLLLDPLNSRTSEKSNIKATLSMFSELTNC